jgi:hypothetical protein
MRAVWSFWSRPYLLRTGRTWTTPFHHFLAWGISLSAAQRYHPDTVLITDNAGKKLLVDDLGLPFRHVSTELERLRDADPEWWALGKLIAYGLQDQPFLHLDTDVFLWRPLPAGLVASAVFAQCPEYFPRHSRGLEEVESAFTAAGSELPLEWQWAASRDDALVREENCGILGGARPDFLRYYAQTAADLVLRPENAAAWSACPAKSNMLLEQFFLSACADFHRFDPASPYRGVSVRYLFDSWEEATHPDCAARAGFTHLLGDSKASPAVARRMEDRVKRDDRSYFQRCWHVAQTLG